MSGEDHQQLLADLIAGLRDPESGIAEEFGSTYAVVKETEFGPLHLLFRLDDGDPDSPEVLACYVGGHLVLGTDAKQLEEMVRLIAAEAWWLFE